MAFDRPVEPVELSGRRARLLPLAEEHIEPLGAYGAEPAIWRYMPVKVETPADLAAHLRQSIESAASGLELPFAVWDAQTQRLAGSTRFMDISTAHRALEIGWTWLAPAAWGTGINTECKYLLLGHAFETLGAIRVFFKTDSRNERSQKALEKIGAVREGVLRHHRILPDGYLRDSVYYSILAPEWPAVKERLEGVLVSEFRGA